VEVVGTNSSRAVAKFLVPDVIFGVGVLSEVGQAARRQGAAHVLVVSDPGVGEAGWTGEVLGHLAEAGVSAQLWDGLTPNPKDHEVAAGCAAYTDGGCDVLVAVGGGSCIDAAKAIAVLATQPGHADHRGLRVRRLAVLRGDRHRAAAQGHHRRAGAGAGHLGDRPAGADHGPARHHRVHRDRRA
jgi:alcohol dehydrogenase class IV